MQEKCDRKLEQLTKRDQERQLDFQAKKFDKDLSNAENEKSDFFEESFNQKKIDITSAIENCKEVAVKERAEHFDKIFKDILALQKYVAASNLFLRTYDVKIYQRNIQELTNEVKGLELELLPKKKFGFKNKRAENKVCSFPIINKLNGNSNSTTKVALDENYCGFKDEINKILRLDGDAILKKDVTLANLDGCTVRIFGSPSTLHMSKLNRCTILSGPVSTSIFADACTDCTLVISCQQLRLHSSTDVHIYLHVTSRAIMEDCERIYIAPYNLIYNNIEKDYENSGLDRTINNWELVDDFNWLHLEKHSPHWSVLDKNKRIMEWNVVTE